MHVVDALHSAAETGTALRGSCTQLNKEHVTRTREAEVLSCPPETIAALLINYTPTQNVRLVGAELLSCVHLFVTPWTAAHQASLCPSPSPGAGSNSCPSRQ